MAWIGALPSGAFSAGNIGQMQTAAEPFVWGGAGQRRTPEQLAAEREMAERMLAAGGDYSPVQSWTQGLARLSEGLIGGLRMADVRKQEKQSAAAGDAITQALLGGGGSDVVTAALLDPSTPKATRDFAEMRYRNTHRPPPQPGEFERALEASGVAPGTPEWTSSMAKRVNNMLDPLMVIPTPQGPYVTPRSQALLGGGDPASASPGGASPPSTLPPDFDFDKGGPTPSASGGFR